MRGMNAARVGTRAVTAQGPWSELRERLFHGERIEAARVEAEIRRLNGALDPKFIRLVRRMEVGK